MNANGSNQVNLTNQAGYDSIATWSPDGTTIIWSTRSPASGSTSPSRAPTTRSGP